MKKIIICVLSLVMIMGVCTTSAFALEDNTYDGLTQDIIEIADEYVKKDQEKLVVINQAELKEILGVNDYNNVIANVENCNQLIEADLIGIKEHGSLYIQGDDELTIQGGNINATRLYWWGWHRYNNCYNTKKIVKEFKKQANYSNSATAKLIFGGLAGVPGGFLLASIPDLVGGSLKSFANKLEKKNKGYGTIIAANWIVVGSNIKSQTKNTK